MEAITKVNTVVMDKTGTLTQGVFNVQKIATAGDITENELLKIIASVETQSTHPIAKAVVEYAKQQKVNLDKVEDVKEIAGHGLEATVTSKKVLVGNAKLLTKNQIEFSAELASIPETIVVCAINGIYSGYILVADAPKEDAKNAVDSGARVKTCVFVCYFLL